MIKNYKGQKAEKRTAFEALPAGGYVAKIVGARIEDYDWGSVVIVAFDIAEGEQKGFFQKRFEADTSEDKKWKGTYRLNIPDEKKSKYYDSDCKNFNNFIFALEDSNEGYHYDNDESKFKGKIIGVIYRNREWEWNGDTGWTTECGAVTDVTSIREGKYRQLKDKPLKGKSAAVNNAPLTANDSTSILDDDDLPF